MAEIKSLYAQYLYPGSFMPEEGKVFQPTSAYPTLEELVFNQVNDNWFCVEIREKSLTRVTDDEGNSFFIHTPGSTSKLVRRIYIGEFYTHEQVYALEGDTVLYRNLKYNRCEGGVKTRVGNWQLVLPDDIVFDTQGNVRYSK